MGEALGTSRLDRELMTQLMFEQFNVTGLFMSDQAVLSLYALGKLTGCVIDLGHGTTGACAKGVGYSICLDSVSHQNSCLDAQLNSVLQWDTSDTIKFQRSS